MYVGLFSCKQVECVMTATSVMYEADHPFQWHSIDISCFLPAHDFILAFVNMVQPQASTASSRASGGPRLPDVKTAINDIRSSVAQPFVLPRRPRSDEEAQRLYYHIRTLCYWLDAANTIVRIPYLDKLPFTFGIEAIIGTLVPVAGEQ